MRALLVLFLTSTLAKGLGLERWGCVIIVWHVYNGRLFTPVIGGLLADRYLGYRWAVILGALAMTLGHAMAVETPLFYISGWILMVGNGLFKPNMTSIISTLMKSILRKRWSLFSLLYGCKCRCLPGNYALRLHWWKISWVVGIWTSGNLYVLECYSSILLKIFLVLLV
jgi:POT family proton-dependent oligopeptide transporter